MVGWKVTEILISCHIVRWVKSTKQEKHDPDNGILLTPVYDALFDKNLISFLDEGHIIISRKLAKEEVSRLSNK